MVPLNLRASEIAVELFSTEMLLEYVESITASAVTLKQVIIKRIRPRFKIAFDKIIPLIKLLTYVSVVVLIALIAVNDNLRSISILFQYEDKQQ